MDEEKNITRLSVRILTPCVFRQMGSYHTIDLELNRKFTLYKPEWDVIALERVDVACDISKQADVAAIVCQEGNATVILALAKEFHGLKMDAGDRSSQHLLYDGAHDHRKAADRDTHSEEEKRFRYKPRKG